MFDRVIAGCDLLTMTGEGVGYIQNGAVAIRGRTIAAVGSREDVESAGSAKETIDASNMLVMPGLIDVHQHSPATVARGLAQEVAAWMGSAYGPLVRHADPEDAPLFTMVALMEGVANGTTTVGDYAANMTNLLTAHEAMGNRAVVCNGITEIDWKNRERWAAEHGWKPGMPAVLDPNVGEAMLQVEIDLYDTWNGRDEGRIRTIFGPLAADMLSEAMLVRAHQEAQTRGLPIHIHTAQDPRENDATMIRAGLRAIPYLDSIGLLTPDTITVHISTSTPDEVALVAHRGCRMACCTNSIGIIDGVVPPATEFLGHGGVVGLGSDQAAGNNTHNIFAEMRSTAMFAKIKSVDPEVLPAWQVLRMATIGGAQVLGVDDVCGSLEVGKDADLIMIDLSRPPMLPVIRDPARNLVANLVYGETGSNVRMTMVAGRVIYADGEFTRIDASDWATRAQAAADRFAERVTGDPAIRGLPITQLTAEGLV